MSPDGVEAEGPVATLIREAAAGKARPAYLFVGDAFRTRAAARALIGALVPAAHRSLNVETYDGRAVPLARILDSARTPGFFPGVKVIWVRDSPAFLSPEKRPDVTRAMFAAWEAGREREATERLVTLVALAGWSDEQFREARWEELAKTRLREVFGTDLDARQLGALREIHAASTAQGLRVAGMADESGALVRALEGPRPEGTVLLFTAAVVDGRTRVVRRLAEAGAVVDLSLPRERSGALTEDAVRTVVRAVAASCGKEVSAAALALIVRRAGTDPGELAGEVEKACLHAGERSVVEPDDVAAVMRDLAESWVFDFTGALAARDLGAALGLLRDLLDAGEPPLRLLGAMAREVRVLLLARESLDHELRDCWRGTPAFPEFQRRILPRLGEATREALGAVHPYVLYRRLLDARQLDATALRAALVDLAEIDRRLKASAGPPGLVLEAFVLRWCGRPGAGRQHGAG